MYKSSCMFFQKKNNKFDIIETEFYYYYDITYPSLVKYVRLNRITSF